MCVSYCINYCGVYVLCAVCNAAHWISLYTIVDRRRAIDAAKMALALAHKSLLAEEEAAGGVIGIGCRYGTAFFD